MVVASTSSPICMTLAYQSFRVFDISPVSFRVGDIVEAQFSAVAYQVKGGVAMMGLILRSVAMLDSTHTQVPWSANLTIVSNGTN